MRRMIQSPAPNRPAWASQLATARRALAIGITFAAVAATAACSSSDDSPTSPGNPTPGGAYAMRTARGFAVPHTFTDAVGKKLTIEGGKLTLGPNGTYELNYKGKLNSLVFDLTDEGKVVISGSKATFTPDDGDPSYIGTVSGKKINVNFKVAGAMFDLGFTGN